MFLDRILYPITALGPGKRIGIWVSGCSRRCSGCANPELWKRYPEQQIEEERLALYINSLTSRGVDGITITGGEPFEQAEELVEVIDKLKTKPEILVFSGYTLEELKRDKSQLKLLDRVDVLIDSPYIDELNDGKATLRGSINQNIHFLNKMVKDKYQMYIQEGRKIQNFIYDYKTISVGIHNPTKTER